MQIGIRLHDTAALPIEDRLAEVKRQGFSCVHLALSKISDLPADSCACTPGYGFWLKRVFAEAGLDIAVLGCYLNLADPDAEQLEKNKSRYFANIRLASILGAGVVGTETGAPNHSYSYDREACRSESAYITFRENLKDVVAVAEHYGVIIAVEPVYRHIIYSPARARRLLDEVASENLKIIFDPVNLIDPAEEDRRDEVIGEAIDLLSEEIAVIHLKDYLPEGGELKAVPCGSGKMDYRKILRFAVEKKPFIQATLENTSPENAEKTLQLIEGLEREITGEVQREK